MILRATLFSLAVLAGCTSEIPDLRPVFIPGVCANETHRIEVTFRANFDGALNIGSGEVTILQIIDGEYVSLGCEVSADGPS